MIGRRVKAALGLVWTLIATAAAAQEPRLLSAEEDAAFRAAYAQFARRLDPFNAEAVARFTPHRIIAQSAAAQGVGVEAAMAAKAEFAGIAGFSVSNVEVAPPSAPAEAIATGEILCVIMPARYETIEEGGRERHEVDLLAIRDAGRWGFMMAARTPWRKVELRRTYGAFICSR